MRFTSQLRSFVLVILLPISLVFLFGISFRREIGSFVVAAWFLGSAFFPEKNLTMQEGEKWYSENKEALMELHKVVLQTTDIRRVEPSMSSETVLNLRWATPKTMGAYKEMEQKCVSLGIKHIATEREGRDSKGVLISVCYTLSSSGLSVSGGKDLCVEFLLDESIHSMLCNDSEYILKPLDETNWYVVDYRDGRK